MSTTVTCPNCGYKQGPTAKCRKCSTLFDYHYQGQPTGKPPDADAKAAEDGKEPAGILGKLFGRRKSSGNTEEE